MSAKQCPEIVLKFDKNLVLKFHFGDWDPCNCYFEVNPDFVFTIIDLMVE